MHSRHPLTPTPAAAGVGEAPAPALHEKISFDQLWILLDVLKAIHPETGKLMRLEDVLMIGTEKLNINGESQSVVTLR